MKKLQLLVTLTYNDYSYHDDEDTPECFYDLLLNNREAGEELLLHSNFIGDTIGEIGVNEIRGFLE